MLRGWPDWRGLHRALAALLLALWLPIPYGFPLLAATTGSAGMSCCRHKTQCCCRKQNDPAKSDGPAWRSTLCGSGCKVAALSGPVAPVLVVASAEAPILAVSGAQPPPVASVSICLAIPSCLYQRPPPFQA